MSETLPAKRKCHKKVRSKTVKVYAPEGLEIPDECPAKAGVLAFVGLIFYKQIQTWETEDGSEATFETPIPLKMEYLRSCVPQCREAMAWAMERLNVVERVGSYEVGKKSFGYRLTARYRRMKFVQHTFEHPTLHRNERNKTIADTPLLKRLLKHLKRITVDEEMFDTFWGHSPKRHFYRAHLQMIVDGDWHFRTDDFSGRLHSNLTNMAKPARACLRVDGLDAGLGELDISNSQPLFMAIAAEADGATDPRYRCVCESGKLYETLSGNMGQTRAEVKKQFMHWLFSRNGNPSCRAMNDAFKSLFPTVHEWVQKTKKGNSNKLARRLQIAERSLIVDSVCATIAAERPSMFIATIHDSLLFQKPDHDYMWGVMTNEFQKLGLSPKLSYRELLPG